MNILPFFYVCLYIWITSLVLFPLYSLVKMSIAAENMQPIMLLLIILFQAVSTLAVTHRHIFIIQSTSVTRLCKKQNIITVNGKLPGPTLYVHSGDELLVKVRNKSQYNATIHWHGVRQLLTAWSDGPQYITQCPIQPSRSYTYRFTIDGQEGTLWWHAHASWLRATVHGALVIYPKKHSPYPFPTANGEASIVIGEWWNGNPMDVINEATSTGGAPNVSDAFTINGQPGDLYPCSSSETFLLPVRAGQTYLLRLVNAAMDDEVFFKIANHNFTVVNVDAAYTKPYQTDVMIITPGQTACILLTANQPPGRYYIAARAHSLFGSSNFDNTTTTAILEYRNTTQSSSSPILPDLPPYNDTATAIKFNKALRSLATPQYPVDVPQTIDNDLVTTIGVGVLPCADGNNCTGPNGLRFAANMNNVSFVLPTISLLQAYYFHINGVYTTDFPPNPPFQFNYTGQNISTDLWTPVSGTKVVVLKYNDTVQIVLQGTNIIVGQSHPMHLHGYNFYIVGQGFGNYDSQTDPLNFNLVDPPSRNTVDVPASGWAAIRFRADNPGVWYMHCHYDGHLTWGLSMAFLVENGSCEEETLKPPPPNLPKC